MVDRHESRSLPSEIKTPADVAAYRDATIQGQGMLPGGPALFDQLCDFASIGAAQSEKKATDELDRSRMALAWAVGVFGEVALDEDERAMRFIEEALELVQACGLSDDAVQAIVERVYGRRGGDRQKEFAQAQFTLELLAQVFTMPPLGALAQAEFDRCRAIPQEEWDRRHQAKVAKGIAK